MEILHGVVVVVVAGAAVIAAGISLLVLYFLVQSFWPVMIGGLGGYLIWTNLDQDLAVIFGIVSLVTQIWWWRHTRKNDYGMMALEKGKQKRYEELTLPRYFDL